MFTNTSQFKNRKHKWSIMIEEVQRLKNRCRIRLLRDHGLVKGLDQVKETQNKGMNTLLATKHQLSKFLSREDRAWDEISNLNRSSYHLRNNRLEGTQVLRPLIKETIPRSLNSRVQDHLVKLIEDNHKDKRVRGFLMKVRLV